MKKYNNLLIFIIAITSIPIFIAIIVSIKNPINIETSNDWISFYGSYIGSIIGVIGVFIVMRVDQTQRNSERRDQLFIKNIELYQKLLKIFKLRNLNKMKSDFELIKKEKEWILLDVKTKSEIEKTIALINKYNETNGLWDTILSFSYHNLYDYFKIPMTLYDESHDIEHEIEDTPHEILEEVTNLLIGYLKINAFDEEMTLLISKEELKMELKKHNLSYVIEKNFNSLFDTINSFDTSKELILYQKGREKLFSQNLKIVKSIESRIDSVLTY